MRGVSLPARYLVLAVAVTMLWSVSVVESYVSGHHAAMYDNPVYRWRESMAIALSRLNREPLPGYVAYRSIRNYLAQHGLGLMAGEAEPLPTWKQVVELVNDRSRMEKLLREARDVPIDHRLPHVTLAGSEKGLADYYYWAFRLFGVNLSALVVLYYLLLAVSVILFFIAFRDSPVALLLLMLYLIGHAYMVDWVNNRSIQTVHNSRFFPVLSVLPAMHLLLLLVLRARPTLLTVALAGIQASMYGFVVFCRVEAAWETVAIVVVSLLFVDYRALWGGRRAPTRALGQGVVAIWPAGLVIASLLGVWIYSHVALDPRYYRTETRTHVFWHPLFSGTVTANPELSKIFPDPSFDYSDNVVYLAVLADLRARNEVPPEIAYRQDGQIHMNAMSNMGVFDQHARRLFFQVVRDHPWLVLQSFVYNKPRDQLIILRHAQIVSPRRGLTAIPMALVAGLIALWSGLRLPGRDEMCRAVAVSGLVAAVAWLPVFIVPSALIVDSLLVYLLIVLLVLAYLPAVAWRLIGCFNTSASPAKPLRTESIRR